MEQLAQLTPETLFAVLNMGVVPFWLLLVVLPHSRITDLLVHAVLIPIILGVTYAWLMATVVWGGLPVPADASFMTLHGVKQLFTVDTALVAGWAHYLVFDLFIGAWQARDAQRVGLNHLLLVPCLLLTFLLGPIGLFSYLMIRGLSGKGGWSLFEG